MKYLFLNIHVFPHDAHRQPLHAGGGHAEAATARSVRREIGKLSRTEGRRRRRAAIHAANVRRSRCPRSGPAAPSDKRARPSYPDYDRRRVEDFAARTRWMPSAVARYSFASCPPLSPNTGVHTTHNARRIFEAIVWRYARSARFFRVRPSLQTTAFEPKTPPSTLGYPFADFTPPALSGPKA